MEGFCQVASPGLWIAEAGVIGRTVVTQDPLTIDEEDVRRGCRCIQISQMLPVVDQDQRQSPRLSHTPEDIERLIGIRRDRPQVGLGGAGRRQHAAIRPFRPRACGRPEVKHRQAASLGGEAVRMAIEVGQFKIRCGLPGANHGLHWGP